jgi:carbon storage regulator
MLVLSRQRDETIMIGDEIEITIVDIRGDKVRLGITAPAHVPVHRKEVYDAIQRENRAAANIKPEDLPPPGQAPPEGPEGRRPRGPRRT